MNKLMDYLRLIRFRYHITFVTVILGVFAFTDKPFSLLIGPLVILYLSFNVFLYGGLYTLNDIADIESDKKHPQKKHRPLPAGKISTQVAYLFAFALILAGLAIGYACFDRSVFLLYLLFVLINQIYTRIAKKIPYLELLVNSVSHPMRFLLGAFLVTSEAPYALLGAIFLLAFGLACVRRVIERKAPGWEVRKVLRHYTPAKLAALQVIAFGLIILIGIMAYPIYRAWYAVILVIYLVLVFGIYFSESVAGFFKWMWVN